ncbi:hypothetical protein F441_04743, partial [Phytophthora nicotianae CJ01A1]
DDIDFESNSNVFVKINGSNNSTSRTEQQATESAASIGPNAEALAQRRDARTVEPKTVNRSQTTSYSLKTACCITDRLQDKLDDFSDQQFSQNHFTTSFSTHSAKNMADHTGTEQQDSLRWC